MTDDPTRQLRSGFRLPPDEPEQMIRLARFRQAHPGVIVGDGGFGTVQARIPEDNGETVITRYTLRELLDKLTDLDLEELGRAWGDTYDIGTRDGRYYARRSDGTGEALEGDSPDLLQAAIRADSESLP